MGLWLPDSRLEMPELFDPKRRPIGIVKPNYNNKFVQDAGEIWDFLDGAGNVVGMKHGTPLISSLASSATWQHAVLHNDGTNGAAYGTMDTEQRLKDLAYSAGTLVIRFSSEMSAETVSCLFQFGASNGYDFFDNTFIYINSQTSTYTDESVGLYVNDGTANVLQIFARKGHNFFNDGAQHEVVFVVGDGDNRVYVDGKRETPTFKIGSATTTGQFLNYAVLNRVYLGQRYYDTQPGTIRHTGEFHHLAIYPTFWSDKDAASHWDNHNQIFLPS